MFGSRRRGFGLPSIFMFVAGAAIALAFAGEQIVVRFARRAEALDVQLSTNLERGAIAMIDPHRMLQVLSNLVANALRAVAPGDDITVTVSVAANGTRRIEVGDTGEGIAADRLDAIFDRFHKGIGSGGSGLGLTISRDLVEAHGGKIVVESEQGDGTTVGITLPAPVASD